MSRAKLTRLIVCWLQFALLCSSGVVPPAQAHTFFRQAKSACDVQLDEQLSVLDAKDWLQLDRLARRYVRSCREASGAYDLSIGYEHIVMASLEMNRPRDALEAADSCIGTFYANSGCHVLKVSALLGLDRVREARDSFRIAERLVKHALSRVESELPNTRDPSELKVCLWKKTMYKAQLKAIEALRVRHFKD